MAAFLPGGPEVRVVRPKGVRRVDQRCAQLGLSPFPRTGGCLAATSTVTPPVSPAARGPRRCGRWTDTLAVTRRIEDSTGWPVKELVLNGSVALSVGKIAADLGCEAAEPSGPVPA